MKINNILKSIYKKINEKNPSDLDFLLLDTIDIYIYARMHHVEYVFVFASRVIVGGGLSIPNLAHLNQDRLI